MLSAPKIKSSCGLLFQSTYASPEPGYDIRQYYPVYRVFKVNTLVTKGQPLSS